MAAAGRDAGAAPAPAHGARWPALACGCALLMVAGNIYAFGVWSEALSLRWPRRERAHAQALLSSLYECTLVGTYVPLSGFFFHRYGTRPTLLVGAALNTVAYATIFAQFFRGEERAPDALSYVAFFLIGHATSYVDIAIIGSSVRNFSLGNRGTVMGLLKGYFGLSASVLALLHDTGVSSGTFLFVLGPVNSLIVLLCMPWTSAPTSLLEREPTAWWKLLFLLSIEIIIALVLFFFSVLFPGASPAVAALVFVSVALVFGATFFPQRALGMARALQSQGILTILHAPALQPALSEQASSPAPRAQQQETFALLDSSGELANDSRGALEGSWTADDHGSGVADAGLTRGEGGEAVSVIDDEEAAVDSMTLGEALRSPRFWLFFSMLLVLMGAGLFIVGNAARIVASKGGSEAEISALVSVISVSNCLGRVGAGFVADHPVLKRWKLDRTSLLMANLLIMALAQALFALLPLSALPLAGILGGASYGAAWTLDPTILADICGIENFGLLYAIVGFAPTFGSLLFSNILATLVFESHAAENPETHIDECFGNQCFGFAHWFTACAALLAGLTAGPLLSRLQARAKAI